MPATAQRRIAIVGTGFVADLYAASLKTFPDIAVIGCYDVDGVRLARFCAYWNLPACDSIEALLALDAELVLNLTNPHAHYEVSAQALAGGRHVYSEKPLATRLGDARALCEQAEAAGLQIASAPCSMLSQSAQTVRAAIAEGAIGTPRLVYAELDDDFISQAPLAAWKSASGTPWPVEDELHVGCTLEHAGYYLTWLMAMFGPVARVVSAAAQMTDICHLTTPPVAPDYSSASLFFVSGVVARLTCSIVAPHDHRLRMFGDRGVLEMDECWDNQAKVRTRRRFVLRRRLVTSPIARRVKPGPATAHPTVKRWGAAAMNFMLGPAEMLDAIAAGRVGRLSGDFALHLTEVSLAIQAGAGVSDMTTSFEAPPPVAWAGTRTL